MKRWYAVYTKNGAETLAEGHLQRQGFSTYLPRYRKERRHARRITLVKAPLFPRYLFVALDLDRDRWNAVNGTHGVRYLVAMGDRPSAVPDGVVEAIRARETDEKLIALPPQPPFESGEVVRVTGGPLLDQAGIFQCVDDRQRVVVLLDILGRRLTVPLRRDAVAAFG
jgi:transcriptional antiterminator RfaH